MAGRQVRPLVFSISHNSNYSDQMSALAQLGISSNSPKQKQTLSRHQSAVTAIAGGDPYPPTSIVSLFVLVL